MKDLNISPNQSQTPTLARLSFWVPSDRISEFEAFYEMKITPILKRYDLADPSLCDRISPENIFSRVFEVKSPADVERILEAMKADGVWKQLLSVMGKKFGTEESDGLIRHSFKIYETPVGSGREVAIQPKVGHWRTYNMEDGLPGATVFCSFQDDDGYIWVGVSQGLCRYDGSIFKVFNTLNGLPGHDVRSIMQDREGRIWIGTDKGACYYDGSTFTQFDTQNGILSEFIYSIFQDRAGYIWFATFRGGVCRYNGDTFITFNTQNGLPDDRVRSITQDQEGNVWFATDKGACRYDGQGFTTFDTHSGLPDNLVYTIVPDRNGHLWFGTYGGVCRYDGHSFTTFKIQDGLTHNRVRAILQDREGYFWFGTDTGSLVRYDGDKFTVFTTQDGLTDNTVYSIMQDREGHLWFGTACGGICQYDPSAFNTFDTEDGFEGGLICSILKDKEDCFWFSAQGSGVYKYDGEILINYKTQDGLPENDVKFSCEDREGNLWFAIIGGVCKYDGHFFSTFTTQDGLPHNDIRFVFQDYDENIWFGPFYNGASCYDGQTFKTYTEKDGLPHFRLKAMIQDHEGNTWFGTTEGLSRYDGQSFTTYTEKDGLPHNQIQTLQQDNQGNVWVSTLDGLCRFDGKTWISFSDQDNLIPRLVYSIFQDKDRNLWFGTQNGVWRYDGKVFQNMLEQDGLSGNAVSAIFQDRDGTLWFGTNKGVSRFDQPTPVSPSVVIESIIADRRHQAEDNVVIPDSTSLFVIEYHGISFKTRPGGLVFRYRLKGYDQQWYTTRAVKIEYQDLPRGNYIFQIQAVDRDLAYSDIQTLTFMIEPDPQVEALTQALNQAGSAGKFIGESSALKHIQEQLGSVAVTNLTVLIFGETGTGKGVAARTLHSLSPRKAGPFVQINCGAIPEGLVESELFGHEKGAFTGAVSRKLGKIELAKGGTLFLDEIGDLALDAQVKLLHLLEEGIFERVGDTASLEADVRVVAATNRDLEKMVAEGSFREDLFFRLQVFPVRLPPLRERQEDILQLAMYFLQRMAAHLNKAVTGFTSEALSTLNSYGWPGNVRELEHAVQRAVIVCPGPVIRAEDFAVGSAGEESPVSGPFLSLEEVERRHIHEALEQTGWTIKGPAGAAKLLGLHPSTLRHRMKKLGLIRS